MNRHLSNTPGTPVLFFVIAASLLPWSSAVARTIEDILVTAQRIEASLQETPISITALTGDQLRLKGIQTSEQLAGFTPGLQIQRDVIGKVVIRGIGTENFTVAGDPGVALNMDGTYISRSSIAIFDLFDMERVEVLRGPQGTLYGRNATGGAINFITQKPTDEFDMDFQFDAGDYDKLRFEGAVGGPIVDGVLNGRIATLVFDRDGFTDNKFPGVGRGLDELDSRDLFAVRGSLSSEIGRLSLDFRVDYYDDDSNPIPYKYTDDPLVFSGQPGSPYSNPLASQERDVSQGYETDLLNGRSADSVGSWDQTGASLTAAWDLGNDLTLKSISAYRNFQFTWLNDGDGIEEFLVNYYQDDDSDLYTQELQLLSEGDGAWTWILGAYFLYEDSDTDTAIPLAEFGGGVYYVGDAETTAYAGFGQVNWQFADRWSLTAGARYSYEEKEVDYTSELSFIPLTLPVDEDDDWDSITPKVGIDFFLNEDVMFYASVTKGFKSGGFNLIAVQSSYDDEEVWSYEIGSKGTYFDGRLLLNASAFYYDYDDLQVGKVVNLSAVIENAAEATIYGAEIEATALITDNLQFDLGLSLLDTEYDEFLTEDPGLPTGTGEVDLDGNDLPRSPEYSGYVSGLYTLPLPNQASLEFWANLQFTDEQFFTQFNRSNVSEDSYELLNAKLSYVTDDGKWRFSIYGDNLTDEDYFTNALESGVPTPGVDPVVPQYFLGAPRTWGVQVRYRTE
ncbi:MAG: TonB-dependent receptor [Chromatiales bacterium]|nr:MAG: TonB-dependent receptor [Chromatiales bacterium]